MDNATRQQVWAWADLLVGSVTMGRLGDAVRRGTLLAARPQLEYLVAVELGLRISSDPAPPPPKRPGSVVDYQLRRLGSGIALSRGEPAVITLPQWNRARQFLEQWISACHRQSEPDLERLWRQLAQDKPTAAPFSALLLARAAGMR